MKKLFFSLVAAVMCATATFAQYPNVATLSHDNDVKAFYGDSAFVKVMAEAVNGDYVTLSSGRFLAPIVTKAVTIRGAGMWNDDTDSLHIIAQTIVEGTLDFNIPDDVTEVLSMEGVYVKGRISTSKWLRNASFVKCELSKGWDSSVSTLAAKFKDVTFLNCFINSGTGTNNYLAPGGNILLMNSFIKYLYCEDNRSYANIFNCYVYGSLRDLNNCMIYNSVLSSSIVPGSSASIGLPPSASCYNCVAGYVSSSTSSYIWFDDCTGSGNTSLPSVKDLKKDVYYNLTDEAAAKYLGTDGTQVGMYGGASPFSPIPNYPRIKKFNVMSQPTTDGKIDVEIEVSNVAE